MKRVELAAVRIEEGSLTLNLAASAYDVTPKEIVEHMIRQEQEDKEFIQEMCSRL
jgi:hypothetical protein